MRFKKVVLAAFAVLVCLGVNFTGAAAANAAQVPPAQPNIILWRHENVVNLSSFSTTNYSNPLTYCVAGSPGISCSISTTVSATRSIGVSLGVTVATVAAQLSIGSSSTVSVSVSCTSGPLQTGQRLYAYPEGTKFNYRIRVTQNYAPTDTTSGPLTAFSPNGAIFCRVE